MRITQEVYAKKTITTRQYREGMQVKQSAYITRCSDPDQRQEEAKKQMTREEQMHGKCLKDSIRIFLKPTGEGPVYVCSLCYRTHFVDNVQDVASLQPGSHRTTLDSCLTRYKSIHDKEWICLTCKRGIYNDLVPKLSVANIIGFPECPPELELYPPEETLVASLLPFMTIHSLPVCGHTANGQMLIVGNMVHVPNDISSTVNNLQHNLDEMGTVPIQLKRKKPFKPVCFGKMCILLGLWHLSTCSKTVKCINNTTYLYKQQHGWKISETVMIRTDSLLKDTYHLVSNDIPEHSTSESNSDYSTFEEISQAELKKGNLDTMLTDYIPLSTV